MTNFIVTRSERPMSDSHDAVDTAIDLSRLPDAGTWELSLRLVAGRLIKWTTAPDSEERTPSQKSHRR